MKVTLNLASRRYVNRRALNQFGILFALLLLVILGFQVRDYLQQRGQLQMYVKNLAEMNQGYQQLQGETPRNLSSQQVEEQRADFLQAEVLLRRDAFRWTTLFDRMEKRLPSGVSITSFNPDYKTNSVELGGVAKTLADLQRLLKNLHKESFSQVFLQNQSEVIVKDKQGVELSALSFKISLEGGF